MLTGTKYKIILFSASLDTVTDFLIKLGIKPCMHLLEIGIFLLNHVIVKPTKIMNNLLKDCKILTFNVIFQHQKSTESFWIFLWRIFDQLLPMKFLIFKVFYFLKMCPFFVSSVHNFSWSDSVSWFDAQLDQKIYDGI